MAARGRCRRRHRQCPPPERAESAFDAPARTADRPRGLGHSAQRLKTARAGGLEREENYEPRLLDPSLAQRAATVGYVAAGAPLLAVSSLHGADGVDDTAVKFLLRAGEVGAGKATPADVEEEEEEEKEEAVAEVFLATSYFPWCSHWEIWTLFLFGVLVLLGRIQSMRQFSEALVIFHPEVVPESGHSSTHP